MLSLAQRKKLQRLLHKQHTQAAIARRLGVHRSTVKRELERNSVEGKYRAVQAQELATQRKKQAGIENQQKRLFQFYDVATVIDTRIKKRLTLRHQDTKKSSGPQKDRLRYDFSQLRFSEKTFKEYRFNRKRKQRRRKKLDYLKWKRWYNKRFRERDLWLENFKRDKRPAREMWKYYKPHKRRKPYRPNLYRLKKKKEYDQRRARLYLKSLNERLADMFETQELLERIRKKKALKTPLPLYPTPSSTTSLKVDGMAMPAFFILKIFKLPFGEEDFVFDF
jgi:hypothetical protein